jgi:hypothetical protein
MIKFFKKIRQNVLSEGKTGKYFKYAIGEIFLVVIGILIALSINNWSENRKSDIALNVLINNLHDEFNMNLQELNNDLARLNKKIGSSESILSLTGTKVSDDSEFKIDSLLFYAITNPTWNPSTYILNDIKNSGKLSLIKNSKLKQLLFQWERLYEDILEWQNSLTISNQFTINFIKLNGSLINIDHYQKNTVNRSKFNFSNLNLLQEMHFENEIEDNQFTARELAARYKKADSLLQEIIELSKTNGTYN